MRIGPAKTNLNTPLQCCIPRGKPYVRDEPRNSWFPLGRYDFEDEQVISCYLGKVLQVWRGRAAWWGRWSSNRTEPLFDLATAKCKVEAQRSQGSRWTIEELPMAVISGEKRSLLVVQDSSEPLSTYLPLKGQLRTLKDYGEYFEPRRPNSTLRLVCSDRLRPAVLPFWQHEAGGYHGGKNYYLRWYQSLSERDLEGVLRVIHRINKRLQLRAPQA